MKTLIVLLLTTLAAGAQTYLPAFYAATPFVYTNSVPDNYTYTNTSPVLDMTRHAELALQFQFRRLETGSVSTVTFPFSLSLDNTNWPATPAFTVTVTSPAHTNLVVTNLTLNTGALGYLRMDGVTVGSSGYLVTNMTILYSPKPYRK